MTFKSYFAHISSANHLDQMETIKLTIKVFEQQLEKAYNAGYNDCRASLKNDLDYNFVDDLFGKLRN